MEQVEYLECINSKSKKFYELLLQNNDVIIRAGRINHIGRLFKKTFNSPEEAYTFFQKQILKKKKKGYRKSLQEVTQLCFFSKIEILSFIEVLDDN